MCLHKKKNDFMAMHTIQEYTCTYTLYVPENQTGYKCQSICNSCNIYMSNCLKYSELSESVTQQNGKNGDERTIPRKWNANNL